MFVGINLVLSLAQTRTFQGQIEFFSGLPDTVDLKILQTVAIQQAVVMLFCFAFYDSLMTSTCRYFFLFTVLTAQVIRYSILYREMVPTQKNEGPIPNDLLHKLWEFIITGDYGMPIAQLLAPLVVLSCHYMTWLANTFFFTSSGIAGLLAAYYVDVELLRQYVSIPIERLDFLSREDAHIFIGIYVALVIMSLLVATCDDVEKALSFGFSKDPVLLPRTVVKKKSKNPSKQQLLKINDQVKNSSSYKSISMRMKNSLKKDGNPNSMSVKLG